MATPPLVASQCRLRTHRRRVHGAKRARGTRYRHELASQSGHLVVGDAVLQHFALFCFQLLPGFGQPLRIFLQAISLRLPLGIPFLTHLLKFFGHPFQFVDDRPTFRLAPIPAAIDQSDALETTSTCCATFRSFSAFCCNLGTYSSRGDARSIRWEVTRTTGPPLGTRQADVFWLSVNMEQSYANDDAFSRCQLAHQVCATIRRCVSPRMPCELQVS